MPFHCPWHSNGEGPSFATSPYKLNYDPSTIMISSKVASTARPSLPRASLASSAPRPQAIDDTVTLSRPVRALIWSTIFCIAVANTALLALFAKVYVQNEQNDSLLWLFRLYFLYSESNTFIINYSFFVGVSYAVLSAIFGLVTLNLLREAIATHRQRVDAQSSVGVRRRCCFISHAASAVHQIKVWYSRWHEAVGVRGPYFELRHLAGELVEISSQTVAVVSASQSISNAPLNIAFAVVIFLNCVASTVIPRVCKSSTIKQRIACLLTDVVLDFVWGTLLPIWMYLPLIRIYLDRENILNYNESFSNSTREIERVLIVSWQQFVISIIPFCSSFLSLLKLRTVLRNVSFRAATSRSEPIPDDAKSHLQVQTRVARVSTGIFVRVAHALLAVYGLCILIITLRANDVLSILPQNKQHGCINRVYPWFSTKEACLGRQINCTTLGIRGSAAEMEQALDLFDKSSLADLFVLSCPGFEMPPKIQSFTRLMTIVIKESTVVDWSEAAMLREEHFHELRTVQLNGVTLLQDPIGLTGVGPITSSVEWIHLEGVDGVRILNLVGDNWKGLVCFDCMSCGLTSIPEVLYHMPKLTMVSLALNDLTMLPDDWIPRSQLQLQMLWLDVNLRLVALPDSLWRQAATCGIFSVSWTNLSAVPEWVAGIAGPDFRLTAIDTPVCRSHSSLPPQIQSLVECELG